jgi:AcrR family transcriptional regulator
METVRAGGPQPPVGSADWWAAWQERQARRRPRADGLTIERVVAAAATIVDNEGLTALTVRRIAESLGTGSATLYRHVASREELLELVLDQVIGEVELPPAELPGRRRCELLSTELRRVLLRHAALVPVVATSRLQGPNATDRAVHGLRNLVDAGFDQPVALQGYLGLLHFVIGSVFFEANRSEDIRHHPHDPDEVFAFGLKAFLDGMEAEHLAR